MQCSATKIKQIICFYQKQCPLNSIESPNNPSFHRLSVVCLSSMNGVAFSGYFIYDAIDIFISKQAAKNWEVLAHHAAVS